MLANSVSAAAKTSISSAKWKFEIMLNIVPNAEYSFIIFKNNILKCVGESSQPCLTPTVDLINSPVG